MSDTVCYFRRSEAAQHVREKYGRPCSIKLLNKLAVIGGGPPFRKSGRFPVYPKNELDAWAESRMSPLVNSTSELRPAA